MVRLLPLFLSIDQLAILHDAFPLYRLFEHLMRSELRCTVIEGGPFVSQMITAWYSATHAIWQPSLNNRADGGRIVKLFAPLRRPGKRATLRAAGRLDSVARVAGTARAASGRGPLWPRGEWRE